MKLLLIRPLSRFSNLRRGRPDYIPLGLASVASYLMKHGIDVEILDNNTECLDRDELYEYLKSGRNEFDVCGITAMATQYSYVKHLSMILKDLTGWPIILGGPLATYSAELVLNRSAVDFCVLGEGQETALDLMNNLDTPERVPGICFRGKDGRPQRTPPRVFKEHLDDYPFPAYDSLDMSRYLNAGLYANPLVNPNRYNKLRISYVSAGIGCPYRCRFCTTATVKARLRSVDNVIAEIKYLKGKYGIDGVNFADDLLIMGKKRTREFCDKIGELKLLYCGQARANAVDDEIVLLLKKSGCTGYGIGVESGSERMLRLMRKNATVEQNRRALLAGKKYDMAVKVQLLFGFPGENRESVEETLSLFRETGYPPRRFNILTPLPGSAVYDDCLELGIIKDEDQYLDIVSKFESGWWTKKLLINLTEWTEQEFIDTLMYAESEMQAMAEAVATQALGPTGRVKRVAQDALMRLQQLPSTIRNSRRLRALLAGQLPIRPDEHEARDRFYNLSPFLPSQGLSEVDTESDSWKDVTPEKIRTLIQRYTPLKAQVEFDTGDLDLPYESNSCSCNR